MDAMSRHLAQGSPVDVSECVCMLHACGRTRRPRERPVAPHRTILCGTEPQGTTKLAAPISLTHTPMVSDKSPPPSPPLGPRNIPRCRSPSPSIRQKIERHTGRRMGGRGQQERMGSCQASKGRRRLEAPSPPAPRRGERGRDFEREVPRLCGTVNPNPTAL